MTIDNLYQAIPSGCEMIFSAVRNADFHLPFWATFDMPQLQVDRYLYETYK